MPEFIQRKLSYLLLAATFAYVYGASWVYSHIFRRRRPLGRVQRIAAVWYCPPELPGSNLRMGGWKSLLEADGYIFDNFSIDWMADLQKFDHSPWSWRYSFFRRRLLERFRQFRQLRHYDVVWVERSFVLGPLKRAFMEQCLRRMVGKVVLDCTDGGDYERSPEFAADAVLHADAITAGCQAIRDFYAPRHPRVIWINWVFPVEPYKAKHSYAILGLPVIGWMGSPGNTTHLIALQSQLRKVAEKMPFRLLVICREPVELNIPGAHIDRRDFGADYYDLLGAFDVGLFPNFSESFTGRGKVAMKHQEFMLCGIPQVCSPIGLCEAILDNDGALIAQAEDEWSERILRLLGDQDLRRRLGERSKSVFFSMYTTETEYPKVREALTSFPGQT